MIQAPKKQSKRPYEAVLIGKQIRYLRRIKDISQETLAKQIGVTVGWIGRIERGIHLPNIRLAQLTFQTDQSFGALAGRLEARGLIDRAAGPGRALRHRLTSTR